MVILGTLETSKNDFHLNTYLMIPRIKAKITHDIINANGPHNGHKTHHQDQAITFVSFSVIKTIANNPKKDTPPEFTSLLICILGLFFHNDS